MANKDTLLPFKRGNPIVSLQEMASQIGKMVEQETGCKTFGELAEWLKTNRAEQSPSSSIGKLENGSVKHG